MNEVDEDMVRALGDAVKSEARLLMKTAAIGQLLSQVVNAVQKLAPLTVLAVALLVELRADLRLVVARQVSLLLELVAGMSKGAAITVVATSELLHVAAHLGLSHLADLLVEHLALLLRLEVSLALVGAGSVDSSASHLHQVLFAAVELAEVALEQGRVRHVVFEAGVVAAGAVVLGGCLRAMIIGVAAQALGLLALEVLLRVSS